KGQNRKKPISNRASAQRRFGHSPNPDRTAGVDPKATFDKTPCRTAKTDTASAPPGATKGPIPWDRPFAAGCCRGVAARVLRRRRVRTVVGVRVGIKCGRVGSLRVRVAVRV